MPAPYNITGYKVTAHFAEIAALVRDAKDDIGSFSRAGRAPATEKEWAQFLTTLLRLYSTLDKAERAANEGLGIARDNDYITATDEAIAAELIARLQEVAQASHPGKDEDKRQE